MTPTKIKEEVRAKIIELNKDLACPVCNGDGFTSEHDPEDTSSEHLSGGNCRTCPVQVQCEVCEATGIFKPASLADVLFVINKKQTKETISVVTTKNLFICKDMIEIIDMWNLKETYDNQSPELYQFLHNILCKKKD